ncbi:uncharacterized protein LOC132279995 [Cornus florida]|uniref:uncharacterized protein LOC132279995 n=1 Tax=Cornus florida TaxID=4283 RepID=UPI0028963B69|nr:uncharacterized protein LOC132279995 [Cornus florida]
MVKPKRTIDCFFQKNDVPSVTSASNVDVSIHDNQHPSKSLRVEHTKVDPTFLERDPGLRCQIWDYPVDERDEVRRAYIKAKPYQIVLSVYPLSGSEKHRRRFQLSWFKLFPTWLEYSPSKDAAYCLPCFLFGVKPTGRPGTNAFTSEGFRSWKKVNDGNRCAFLNHVGGSPCSAHSIAERACKDLMSQPYHIDTIMVRQTSEQVSNNRLRLKVTIDAVRWLTYQACAFRGHDESLQSSNRGNFIEMVKAFASYNDDVARIVLENAPKNAKYTSPQIQKEILHIVSRKVRSILVDEARDESKREQMALVLRYVDKDGFLQERFFDLVHVKDTTSLNLKKDLCAVLSHYNLDIHNLRGQGYDGTSNMRGEWNDLDELETGRGANQIGNLQRPGDTRWSSHFDSVCSLIRLFGPTCSVLNNLVEDGCNYKIQGDTDTAFNTLRSF